MGTRGRTASVIAIIVLAGLRTRAEPCGLRTAISPWGSERDQLPLRGVVLAVDYHLPDPRAANAAWRTQSGHLTATRVSARVTRIDYEGAEGAVLEVNRHRYTLS